MTAYVISYDIRAAAHINPQLLAYVKNNRNVDQWSSPFDGCLLVTSELGNKELSKIFAEFFNEEVSFVLHGIKKGSFAASLPEPVWSWLSTFSYQTYDLVNDTPHPRLDD